MKAWIVGCEEWVMLVHAETRGKAKTTVMGITGGDYNFTDFSAKRIPGLDDKPITYQNAKEAGFQYTDLVGTEEIDEDGYLLEKYFINDCRCDICKGE